VGAAICGQPLALASALQRIEGFAKGIDNPAAEANPASAPMYIINPLHAHAHDALFSTHPATANRVAALQALAHGAPVARSSVPRSGRRGGPWG